MHICIIYFNSSVVRLKEKATAESIKDYFDFNSSVVRLKDLNFILSMWLNTYFNSSVVRLKAYPIKRDTST